MKACRGYTLLLLLAAIAICSACESRRLHSKHSEVTVNITAECTVDPNQDPVNANIGDRLLWQPQDGHQYSVHFKDRTPLNPNGKPVKSVPPGKESPPVTGDAMCKHKGDTKCDFAYYLYKEDAPQKQCSDPGVHVTPY
jgi:hypothetical protein